MSAAEESLVPSALSDLETKILAFEANWWRFAGAKESAIKELFDLSAPRYYQLLNDLIDRDDALMAAACAIANVVVEEGALSADYVVPSVFNKRLVPAVAEAVAEASRRSGSARISASA